MKRFSLLLLVLVGALLTACSTPGSTNDPTPLHVKRILPQAGATNVPVDTIVMAEFTGQLNTQNLGDPVVLKAGDDVITGTYQYDAETMTLLFVPDSHLEYETEYVVELADTVTSQSGASLARAVEWTFTTAKGESTGGGGTPPKDEKPGEEVPKEELPKPEPGMPDPEEKEIVLPGVVSVSPMPWTRAARDTTVDVVFTKEFDAGVLEQGVDVKVYPLFTGLLRAWFGWDIGRQSGKLIGNGDTATFQFNKRLSGNSWYWVFLSIDLEDEVGNPLKGSANWLFKSVSN